ncbi:unnamed protein product, partial [Vitis vinifera]
MKVLWRWMRFRRRHDEEDGEIKRGGGGGSDGGRLRAWHHSRIFRVSRASGGKDRHSKVLTSKGLRDRRVRLSVTTAIQFYDLQDRLGYDQPSKAVEWLIKAASDAIAELPSLNSSFPDTPKQLSDEKRPSPGTEQGFDSHISLSKSACSSTSETSKGSGSSFTELLTGGIGCASNNATSVQHNPRFAGQIHLGNSLPQSPFNVAGDHHPELQHFSFVPDHLIPVATSQPGGSDNNLNFTISSGLAGFNRGTLQSNSPSLLPHLQRFSPIDGSNLPFFMGAAPVENHHHHHQFPPGFDGCLQLYYGDGSRHSDQKGKGKN